MLSKLTFVCFHQSGVIQPNLGTSYVPGSRRHQHPLNTLLEEQGWPSLNCGHMEAARCLLGSWELVAQGFPSSEAK